MIKKNNITDTVLEKPYVEDTPWRVSTQGVLFGISSILPIQIPLEINGNLNPTDKSPEITMTDLMQMQQKDIEIPGEILSAYARILKYPDERYQEHVREWLEALEDYPEIRSHVQPFVQHVEDASLGKLEELFVKTFEMNKKRPLEIGWHLYGEEYKRGQFLVKMRDLLREHGIQENGELPDHLTYCLTVLPELDSADTESFVRKYMHPAIDSIIEGFSDEDNPYLKVVESLSMLLEDVYGRSDEE